LIRKSVVNREAAHDTMELGSAGGRYEGESVNMSQMEVKQLQWM
jgi:hypothetical protein